MTKTKLSARFWCALVIFGLTGQIAWVVENMYLNVFMYKMFHATAADISLMVSASAVAATLTTVLMGALCDRIGKRKLFICAGYMLWGVSIFAFTLLRTDWLSAIVPMTVSAASLGVSLTILLDCVMTFFGSTANDAAFNAWLTDVPDSENRGAAEGINAMMPLLAILCVFGGFMAFNLDIPESWTWIFAIIGVAVIVVGIVGIFVIQDAPLTPSESGYWKNVIYGFRPSTVKAHPHLYISLGLFVLFNISIQIFMPYLIIYYEVSLGMADYVLIMAPAILLASVVTALWGRVYDKKGFGFSVALSMLWLCLGYVILIFFGDVIPVFIGSLLMMCGYLAGMAVFGARIRDAIPKGKAGMLQGIRIFSQVLIPGVVGPWIATLVLSNAEVIVNNDGTQSFVPNVGIFVAALCVALVLVVLLLVLRDKKKNPLCDLTTPFEESANSSWADEYPRPQMRRASYFSLCGEWDLSVRQGKEEEHLGVIRVPFAPESRLSGIGRALKDDEEYVYRKKFSLPDGFGERVLLHFGAVDQIAKVSLNGHELATHTGGYLPFDVEIRDFLQSGENELCVVVRDTLDQELAFGKQRYKRGGMWYTPISGIWQPVWLEGVPKTYISSLRLTCDCESVTIHTEGGEACKTLTLHTEGEDKAYSFEGDCFTLHIENPVCWTPENPHLYPFTISDGKDSIDSYFALRTVSIEQVGGKPRICLNGKPYFFHGLLDQGYYSDGIYLPASPDGYRFDILRMKEQGFNMLRKHIKIEPDVFYYACDKYGMVVFQDMVNSGRYGFLVDTALPTAGLRRGITHRASARRRAHFESDCRETIALLYNHPCVCYYTIFNEGWGQYDADRIYRELKALDPSRIFDATSGWFWEKESDVQSEHIYFKKLAPKVWGDRPLVLSEFGGYACRIDGHIANPDKAYGYRTCESVESLTESLRALYDDEVIPLIEKGLCATVLTQVSDVEDEINGLVTYDRQVIKTDPNVMRGVAERIMKAFAEQF